MFTAENFYCGGVEFFIYYGEGQYHIDEKDVDGYGYEEYKTIFEGTYEECLQYKQKIINSFEEERF